MSPNTVSGEIIQALSQASTMASSMVGKLEERVDRSFEKWDKQGEVRDERIRKLENWQSWMTGIGVCAAILVTAVCTVSTSIITDDIRAIRSEIRVSKR